MRPVPTGWLEALTESRAELASGLTVPGDEVVCAFYESIARLAAQPAHHQSRRITRRP